MYQEFVGTPIVCGTEIVEWSGKSGEMPNWMGTCRIFLVRYLLCRVPWVDTPVFLQRRANVREQEREEDAARVAATTRQELLEVAFEEELEQKARYGRTQSETSVGPPSFKHCINLQFLSFHLCLFDQGFNLKCSSHCQKCSSCR